MQDEKTPKSTKEQVPRITITQLRLGVWNLKIAEETVFGLRKQWKDIKTALPLFRRLANDIFNVAPTLFIIFVLCQIWQGIEDSILLHFSNELLRSIEEGLVRGMPDQRQIISAVLARLACTAFVSILAWYGERVLDRLRTRVSRYFGLELMKAKLRIDLTTSKDARSKQEATARQAWDALEGLMRFGTDLLRTGSQLLLIAHISRSTGGPLFSLVCLAQPLLSGFLRLSIWDKVSFGFADDPHYQRMKALEKLTTEEFRQDVISGALAPWIIDEYNKTRTKLGDTSDSHPYEQFEVHQGPLRGMLEKLAGDLPMIFCAFQALSNPSAFSVASIAILQQSSTNLRYSVSIALSTSQGFRRSIASIKSIYASTSVVNSMTIGDTPYPRMYEKSTVIGHSKGMGFELKDISFSYPGTQATAPSLKNISLTIKPGQLVVIVGANGSGKSTLIRILSRLYDPSAGQVIIDGLPSSSYRINDLHSATALLSQDNLIYPLSLGENIGLGHPECVADDEMVIEAATKGGALEVLEKFKDGMETVLHPVINTSSIGLYGNESHPLYEEMEKIRKQVDISGGEKQRIVAARSFMRFNSGKVKFVAVDEPSSALDADAELKLFPEFARCP
ncbi:P-loop containing nucleoside triphosphate hydrolase protein [Gymnopilus junonius]|uniref:P-loop containing nucleoside triphosphate hydrolase protein n=1 Tax=Gymnopilus junonius TaxID=109634 RepID=A0A9P5NIC1_GYMJU|nr:P-loop containing nucleoside triphosphate hydrolase protein [Gymnopilus junonius]